MSVRSCVSAIVMTIVLTSPAIGQEDSFSTGRKYFAEKKWKEAIGSFRDVVRQDPKNGQGWFWLGISRYWAGAYEGALSALRRADILETNVPFTRFALARVFARTGEQDLAYTWLESAVKAGFVNQQQLKTDEAFAPMMSQLQMEGILRQMQKNSTPAEYDARFRQMDFWIGEWDVFDQAGNQVGTNTITKELGGALLMERWTNASGNQGASINFFDPGTGKFKQQWVDQTGYNTAYEGEIIDGSMVMLGVNADIKGVVSKNRMTFTPNPDGSVTQFIESFNDSTETWSQSFLGTYKRQVKE